MTASGMMPVTPEVEYNRQSPQFFVFCLFLYFSRNFCLRIIFKDQLQRTEHVLWMTIFKRNVAYIGSMSSFFPIRILPNFHLAEFQTQFFFNGFGLKIMAPAYLETLQFGSETIGFSGFRAPHLEA